MAQDRTAASRPGWPASYRTASRWTVFTERHPVLVFAAPAGLVVFVLMVFPVFYTLYMSLHSWFASSVTAPEFVGLANFKRPRRYVFVEAIPKSPVGKLLRRKLIAGEYEAER